MSGHKQWLDNEYRAWVEALRASAVRNFKEQPMVRRMLSLDMEWEDEFKVPISLHTRMLLTEIDNVGNVHYTGGISGACWRMLWYAHQVLDRNPISVVEIGGGVGEFYAVMRALGYEGDYFIWDLVPVQMFQVRYLKEVSRVTGLQFPQLLNFDFCVSFHALGEFDDEMKDWYVEHVVKKCPRGFIVWNPHSGASSEIPFKCKVKDEYPLLNDGNKQLEW